MQPARLQLAERGDEHQELAGGLEVELIVGGEPLQVRDADLGDRHVDQLDAVAQHEREQQVERSPVGIEVELEGKGRRRGDRHPITVAPGADGVDGSGHVGGCGVGGGHAHTRRETLRERGSTRT